jgi:hypothetical protein
MASAHFLWIRLLANLLIHLNTVDLYAYFSSAQKYGNAFKTLDSGKTCWLKANSPARIGFCTPSVDKIVSNLPDYA